MTKRIIVLANSHKRNARCIAGIDVGIGEALIPAGWVRPISAQSEGELEPRHMRLAGGGPISVLDIVEVPVKRHANDAAHPEDWMIDPYRKWNRVSRLKATAAAKLEEKPDDLWLEAGSRSDRVSSTFLLSRQNVRSLYLVRPEHLRFELSVKEYPEEFRVVKRHRARFAYRGHEYEMNLTDPIFIDTYCKEYPPIGRPARTMDSPFGDRCLICVSVTPLYRDYHWKVLATVLELP